ncbi:MAG: hypothetical protein JNK46_15120 [Methylobacteriaceae bacterium]|nr:hypothetical protein [Methylobacteriaceae bacterium]
MNTIRAYLDFGSARPRRVLALRLGAVAAGAATFALLTAPARDASGLAGAALHAGAFAAALLAGSGWRVLAAVAVNDPARRADAAWAGGAAAVTVAALIAAAARQAATGDGLALLAAAAVALNVAFIPAKTACIAAGCCRARAASVIARRFDLRRVEIVLSLAVLAATAALLIRVGPAPAALAGFGGHLGVRLLSRQARREWPPLRLTSEAFFQEILPLLAAALVAAVAATSGRPIPIGPITGG